MAKLREKEHRESRFRRRERPRVETCLNCRTDIETRYCPHCGQENAVADLGIGAVLREFFAEVFFYDSKLWRTLRTLLFHPGQLSSEWSAGRRTSYLSPVRLYLTITFLFFVAAAWMGGRGMHVTSTLNDKQQQELLHQLQVTKLSKRQLALVETSVKNSKMSPEARAKLDTAIAEATNRAEARAKASRGQDASEGPLIGSSNVPGWFGRQIDKVVDSATHDQNTFAMRYIDQFPKVLFIVLPLFAVVLKILYVRQGRYFVEHLVFILHLHSFAFLVLLPFELIPSGYLPEFVVPLLVVFGLPIYAFVAMLRFYRQPWWLTILKGLVLNAAYLLLLAGGALLALLFTVSGMEDPKPTPASSGKPASSAPSKPLAVPTVAPTSPSGAPSADPGPASLHGPDVGESLPNQR